MKEKNTFKMLRKSFFPPVTNAMGNTSLGERKDMVGYRRTRTLYPPCTFSQSGSDDRICSIKNERPSKRGQQHRKWEI